MIGDLEPTSVLRAYKFWAPVYDAVCGPILASGRAAAARSAAQNGTSILEVGVGTGLSLTYYGFSTAFVGIDINERMLAKARMRANRLGKPAAVDLQIMDAHRLDFSDDHFDCAVLPFVLTLVENPEAVLSECLRVIKPGGNIIIVSHLSSERGLAASIEKWAAVWTRPIGLRPDFPFERIANWAGRQTDAEIMEKSLVRPLDVYTLVRIQRRPLPYRT